MNKLENYYFYYFFSLNVSLSSHLFLPLFFRFLPSFLILDIGAGEEKTKEFFKKHLIIKNLKSIFLIIKKKKNKIDNATFYFKFWFNFVFLLPYILMAFFFLPFIINVSKFRDSPKYGCRNM